jgi:hypothetical protein
VVSAHHAPPLTNGRNRSAKLRQHACHGLAEAVFEQGQWNGAKLLRSPFGRLVETILKLRLR